MNEKNPNIFCHLLVKKRKEGNIKLKVLLVISIHSDYCWLHSLTFWQNPPIDFSECNFSAAQSRKKM